MINLHVISRPAIAWGLWPQALLLGLLALGATGLGTNFSSILVHLTASATPRYAAGISGVFSTGGQIAGAIGVAAFGTLYLSQTTHPGAVAASHGFGVVTAAFAFVALIARASPHTGPPISRLSRLSRLSRRRPGGCGR